MKSILSSLLLSLFFLTSLTQADHTAQHRGQMQGYTPQQQGANPLELLKQGLMKLQQHARQSEQNDPAAMKQFIEHEIAPYFDFDQMARWTTRPYYDQMNPQQQQIVSEKMKDMFLTTLTQQLGTFTNPLPRVDFLNPVRINPNEVQVAARVLPANGYPVRLGFRFYRTPRGWKVIDASSNGTSAVFYYRQYFIDLIRNYGPQVLVQ